MQVNGETITATPPAREIAAVILIAPLPAPMKLLAPAHRLATAAQLPPRIRHEYGLRWTPLHRPLLGGASASLKLTAWPILHVAQHLRPPRRLAAA